MCTRGSDCKLRTFGTAGCVVPTELGRKCGQTDTLEIARDFQRCYEMKMKIIDQECGPDCLQDKLKLQREWIEDLKEQNDMLISCIQELEFEATNRVLCLEEKLKESAKCICEKIFDLESDQKSLISLINNGRYNNNWNTDDLRLLTLKKGDIFNSKYREEASSRSSRKMTEQLWQRENEVNNKQMLCNQAERQVMDLEQKVKNLQSGMGNTEVYEDLKRVRFEYDNLKKHMEDMRLALTEEVASKHDMILLLKKDCQQLEERCLQADKQTAFKDDIIKELRKEIKQLKQQVPDPAKSYLIPTMQDHNSDNSCTSQDSFLNDLYCVKSIQKPLVTINHSRKSIPSGKSTVIYIYKEKNKSSTEKIYDSEHTFDCCSNMSRSQKNVKPIEVETKKFAQNKLESKSSGVSLHPCKSENDLEGFLPWENPLRPVKDKSKFTSSTLSRYNTFVGTRRDEDKTISVPNHIPVKMHVKNIESAKSKTFYRDNS